MGALTNRYVTLQVESSYGSEPTAATADLIIGEVDDESFAQNFDLLTRADISRYGAAKTTNGLLYSEGSVNCPLQLDDFNAFLIANAFGVDTYAAGPPKTHTLTETTDDSVFQSFCIRVGREDKEHTYLGMMLDSLSISANVNEYVMMSYNFVGCGEAAVGTLTTPGGGGGSDPPAFSTEDALHFSKAYVRFEAAASASDFSTMVKSISVDINLARDTDNASSLGKTTYAVAPPPTLREITGTIEFNRDVSGASDNEPTYDELRGFLKHDGSTAAPAIDLLFSDGTNSLQLSLINVAYEAPEMNVSGRDTSTMSVNFVALYDAGSSEMARAVITKDGINGDADIFA